MSRGPVARSKAIAEQLPGSLVTLARIDIRAQNHAVVEGAADPFPAPASRAHPAAHDSPSHSPGRGSNTYSASSPRRAVTPVLPEGVEW